MSESSQPNKSKAGAQPEAAEDQVGGKQDREDSSEQAATREVGGPAGPEPTRYGDWERKGRCIDF